MYGRQLYSASVTENGHEFLGTMGLQAARVEFTQCAAWNALAQFNSQCYLRLLVTHNSTDSIPCFL